MNKTKIEWTDYSWNPVVGCKHECWYCYAKKMAIRFPKNFPNGFEPTFHPNRLLEPFKLKKPAKIFCCSISDLFASWTKPEWREEVLKVISDWRLSHLTFQLLTKQPQLIDKNYTFDKNVWVGVTVNDQSEIWKIDEMLKVDAKVRFVSFEPLLSDIDTSLHGIEWVIIGKLTGSRKIKLQKEWVQKIIDEARKHKIPIFVKDNINWHEKIQEFPIE